MITDKISNAKQYMSISPRIKKALEFINSNDLQAMEVGRYDIDGDNLFLLIQSYVPKTLEVAKCEAHKSYIDIQYVIDGSERMGYGPIEDMVVTEAYNPDKDVVFVEFSGDLINYDKGMFAIFFPQDGHMPGVQRPGCNLVKKAVFKIKIQA